jgi:hypothetical protein
MGRKADRWERSSPSCLPKRSPDAAHLVLGHRSAGLLATTPFMRLSIRIDGELLSRRECAPLCVGPVDGSRPPLRRVLRRWAGDTLHRLAEPNVLSPYCHAPAHLLCTTYAG